MLMQMALDPPIHTEIFSGPDIIFTALLLSNLSSVLVIASFITTLPRPINLNSSIAYI